MKNLMVANFSPRGRVRERDLVEAVEAQVENSLALGWSTSDLVLVTNLDLKLDAVVIRAGMTDQCLTGSKMFALELLFEDGYFQNDEIWWAHDLDAWQNYWFEAPDFLDIGLAEYSIPKFNGGSVFVRAGGRDLVERIVSRLRDTNAAREEPTINEVLRRRESRPRVTTLNSTYNLGCSGYAVRYHRSLQPVLVSHFHPRGGVAWRTHAEGVNKVGKGSVCPRLLSLLRDRFRKEVK